MEQSGNLEDFVRKGTQYLIAAPVNDYPLDFDPWACLPAWDVDTACKAITLSRMVDIEESRKIGNLESELKVGENPAIARHICTVYDRARIMADMAIKIGILNDPDTPANWINWAEENRYAVEHLKFIVNPEAMEAFKQKIDEFADIDISVPTISNLPIENSQNPAIKPVENDIEYNKLATLFDPVTLSVLKNMFKTIKWDSWAKHASANGLINVREGRGKYNPYKAALWFLNKNVDGWDLARCNRVLANNLPVRSNDERHLFTGNFE